jgi:hypothetical protein
MYDMNARDDEQIAHALKMGWLIIDHVHITCKQEKTILLLKQISFVRSTQVSTPLHGFFGDEFARKFLQLLISGQVLHCCSTVWTFL